MGTALTTSEHNKLHFHGFEQDLMNRDLRVIIVVGIDATGNQESAGLRKLFKTEDRKTNG